MMFNDYDLDHNGTLSKREILPNIYNILYKKQRIETEEDRDNMMEKIEKGSILDLIFMLCDEDDDDELNFLEFCHFIKCFEGIPSIKEEHKSIIEILALFNAIDVDLSGKISLDELQHLLDKIGRERKYRQIKKDLTNLEEYAENLKTEEAISKNDFLKALIRKDEHKKYKKSVYTDLFNLFDSNKNGKLDQQEITFMLNTLYPKGVYLQHLNVYIVELLGNNDKENELSLKELIPFFDALNDLDEKDSLSKDMIFYAFFKLIDKDANGIIESDEFEVFKNLKIVQEHYDKYKDKFEEIGDKDLTLEEFIALGELF